MRVQQNAKSRLRVSALILHCFSQHSPKLESLQNNCWMRHFMLVILETTPPSPVPANARPQMAAVRPPPTRLSFKKRKKTKKQNRKTNTNKQGSYFLWLQAGFRSLCPLIYQRTAVLRLCDDQSPLPSVSLTQSLSRSISSSALSFPPISYLCFSASPPPLFPHIPTEHLASPPLFSVQIPWSLCALSLYSRHMDSFGICCFLLVHTQIRESSSDIPQPLLSSRAFSGH